MRLAADASQYDLLGMGSLPLIVIGRAADMLKCEKDAMEERMKQQSIGRLGRADGRSLPRCCGYAARARAS